MEPADAREKALAVVGYFDCGLCDPPLEKQAPRARKKALGMTEAKTGHYCMG